MGQPAAGMHACCSFNFRGARTLPLQKVYMKPLSQISAQRRSHRGEEAPGRLRSAQPVIDSHFHENGVDLRAGNDRLQIASSPLASSFRQLSSEFLATEMKRDYIAEALLFAIIVGVSAWPIVPVIEALHRLT